MEKIEFFGANWSPDCQRIKQYFGEHEIEYKWHNVDKDEAAKKLMEYTGGEQKIPAVVINGEVLVNPSNEELGQVLQEEENGQEFHDLVIVGAGPAGLATSIYTTREDIDTLLLEKEVVGGLAATTDYVENYPGFPDGIGGFELASAFRKQAEGFGAQIELGEVKKLEHHGQYHKLITEDEEYLARTVLIATGSTYKHLDVPGEEKFYGKGVHYCATCDGAMYRDKHLVVVGGGNSASQEGVFLTKFASEIDMLVRDDHIKATDILKQSVHDCEEINVHFNTEVAEIIGEEDGLVEKVKTINNESGEEGEIKTDGVFIFIGLLPNTDWLQGSEVELDDYGFVKTNRSLETNVEGVFCAGDVRSGATQQLGSAVGEGISAAIVVREYLNE